MGDRANEPEAVTYVVHKAEGWSYQSARHVALLLNEMQVGESAVVRRHGTETGSISVTRAPEGWVLHSEEVPEQPWVSVLRLLLSTP